MNNAKEEFINHTNHRGKVICASIQFGYMTKEEPIILKPNYTEKEYNEFLDKLDRNYDDGYGGQELYGMILFEDSYSERGEYDGSEWWENNKKPSTEEVINLFNVKEENI